MLSKIHWVYFTCFTVLTRLQQQQLDSLRLLWWCLRAACSSRFLFVSQLKKVANGSSTLQPAEHDPDWSFVRWMCKISDLIPQRSLCTASPILFERKEMFLRLFCAGFSTDFWHKGSAPINAQEEAGLFNKKMAAAFLAPLVKPNIPRWSLW